MRRFVFALALGLAVLSTVPTATSIAQQPVPDSGAIPYQDSDGNGVSDGLDARLQGAAPSDRFDIIATFAGPSAQSAARSHAQQAGNARVFSIVPGFSGEMTTAQIRGLSRTPGLFRIEEDKVIEVALDAANADFGTEAARQQFGVQGNGVGICVADTGIDAGHEQLDGGKVAGWLDLINGLGSPYDDHGHGTHVASIAAGDGSGGPSAAMYGGVAPGAAVYAVKVFDQTGQTAISTVVQGVEWCVSQPGVAIISLSIGTTEGSDGNDAMSLAANAAVDAGKIVVVAAGNVGDRVSSVGSPGAAEKVITVGAAAEWSAPESAANHSKGVYLAPFSSRGPTLGPNPLTKPDVVAPGVSIMAAQTGTSSGYVAQSGTSMATPFAAGAIALAVEAAGGSLTHAEVKSLIESTAQDRGAAGKDNDYGWGLLDGIALVGAAAGASYTPNAFPPTIDINGSVPDEGKWTMTFDVSDLDVPVAATVLINGTEGCALFLFGICLLPTWEPDLYAQLIDPDGNVLDSNNCPLSGDCGNVARQETIAAMPTVAGTYRLEVRPTAEDPNLGQGGDFTVSVSNGTFIEADTEEPTPLIAHWTLDETAGSVASDSSGNGHDGTLVNEPQWRPGLIANALDFDGSDDRVDLPASALDGLSNMTLALWLQTTKTGTQGIVSAANSGNTNEMLLFLNSHTDVRFYTGANDGSYVNWSVSSLADGAWHHVAITRDIAAGKVTLYLDGISLGAKSASLSAISVASGGFLLGQEQDSVGGGFQATQALDGALDDVWLYRIVLSEQEIAALASGAVGDSTPPTAPANLAGSVAGATVNLTWDASSDPESGISTYRIYRSTESGGSKTLHAQVPGDQTAFSDSIVPGSSYFYQVTSVNGHGQESDLSNEAGVVPDDFIGHWTFDDGTGTTATDSSTYARNGTLQNGAVWQPGRIGGAVAFDGSNDRIDLPAAALDGVSDVTLSLWINTIKTSGQGLISAATAGNDNELLLFLSGGLFEFYSGETTGSHVEWTIPSLADGSWHHLALVRDAAGDSVTLYVDGLAQPTLSTPLGPLSVSEGGLVAGQEQDSVGGGFQSSQAFSGAMDDLRIYARALTPVEVAELAGADDPTPPSAPEDLVVNLPGGVIALAWSPATDPESGVTGYRLYRGTTSGLKALLVELTSAETSFTDTSVEEGVTYFYEVTAVNGSGVEGEPSPEASSTVEEPLAVHLELDDGNGSVASDSSGNGHDGMLVNGPTWEEGRLGGAVRFDGSNDRIDLPAGSVDGLANVTFASWLKTTKTGQQGVISAATPGNDNEVLLFLRSSTQIEYYTGESSQAYVEWTVPSLADGLWHHIAVVRDALGGSISLYIDGSLVASHTITVTPLSVAEGGFVLGQEQDSVGGGFSSTQAFSGLLDDFRVYARALTADEIATLADAPDETEPSAPAGLTAVASEGGVSLSWSAAQDLQTGVTSYRIYRGNGSGDSKSLLTEVPGDELTYLDESAEPDQANYYEVAAVNGAGMEGPRSNEASSNDLQESVRAHWALDEDSGSMASDSSGNGHDGTLVNGPVWANGALMGGLEFDGGDDRVDLPSNAIDNLEDLTVSLWMNTTKTGGQAVVSAANGSNDNELLIYLASSTKLEFYTGDSTGSKVAWSIPSIADGAWHHVVVVRSTSGGSVSLYLDGALISSKNATITALSVADGGFLLGQEQDSLGGGFSSSQAFMGVLDDVRLYSRALASEEVASLATFD